jgi:hypothetical protein
VRDWSLEQRIQRSRQMRGHNNLSATTDRGVMHYELVRHLVESYRLEAILVYEAMLNETTLEEWIARHRIEGKPRGDEIYVAPGFSIVHKDGDLNNCNIHNLYCFPSLSARMTWQRNGRPPFDDNFQEVHKLATAYTKLKRAKHVELETSTVATI